MLKKPALSLSMKPRDAAYSVDSSEFYNQVKKSVDKGNPVLFAVNDGAHWMIAIGYDPSGDVIIYDPGNGSAGTLEEINKLRKERGKYLYKTVNRLAELS
jgi:uncharacterized membrane-anchored protein